MNVVSHSTYEAHPHCTSDQKLLLGQNRDQRVLLMVYLAECEPDAKLVS